MGDRTPNPEAGPTVFLRLVILIFGTRTINGRATRSRVDHMAENSDAAQARVFDDMLTAEIAAASSRVEQSEQLARKALRVGDSRSHVVAQR